MSVPLLQALMTLRRPALAKALAWTLIGLGALVLLGWALKLLVLTQVVPGLRSMVIGTALSFVLMGGALRYIDRPGAGERLAARLAAAFVVVHALLVLAEHRFGLDLGIDLAGWQAWAVDSNPHPGRMSVPTAIGFTLAGPALLLHSASPPRVLRALAYTLSTGVLLIGLVAIVGYALDMESLFGAYPLAGMAIHTAFGMFCLGTALLLHWLPEAEPAADEAARRLLGLVTWAPALIAVIGAVTGLLIYKLPAERALHASLDMAARTRAEHVTSILTLRSVRAAIIAARPGLADELQRLRANPDDTQARLLIYTTLSGFMPHGFSAIVLRDADGHEYFESGQLSDNPRFELPLRMAPIAEINGQASLRWFDDRLVLRVRRAIENERAALGEIIVEQPLPSLLGMLGSGEELGRTAALDLCGLDAHARLVCLPNRVRPAPQIRDGDTEDPYSRALHGALNAQTAQGTLRDSDGTLLQAMVRPMTDGGLAVGMRIDSAELHEQARTRLLGGALLVALLAVAIILLMRRLVRAQSGELLRAWGYHELVVRSLHEALVLHDANGRVLSANPAAERLMGFSAEALKQGNPIVTEWNFIHEDGSPWLPRDYPVLRTLLTGQAQRHQLMGLRVGDNLRWLEVNTTPVELPGDRDGRGVITSMTDVSARLQADARQRETEQRYQQLINGVLDYAIFFVDSAHRVLTWSRGAETILGYRAAEIVGQPHARFYEAEAIAGGVPAQQLRQAGEQGQYEDEGWRVRKDGSRVWVSTTITALRDDSRSLIGYAIVKRDLTQKRAAEQALARADQLREAILDCVPFSIIATSPEGVITSFNPAAERMLWYSRDEVVGKATPVLIHDAQEVAERARAMSAELGETIEPGFEVFVHESRRGIHDEHEWTYIRRDGSRFPVSLTVAAIRNEDGSISGFLGVAYDITERKRREDYTRHIAQHDELTGLPNRALLNDRLRGALQRAERSGRNAALLMIDLDHFKRVNDSLGHHIGDELLKVVAQRIVSCVRATDTVARMGGDEFIVVLEDCEDAGSPERIAAKIIETIAAPIVVRPHELNVSASIGISLYPRDGRDAQALMKNADSAMYWVKNKGRHGLRSFSSDIEREAAERLEIENGLRQALKRDEFRLHLQPQIDLASGAVVGAEALLRWQSPDLGMVPPDRFIGIAEETGLIVPIGNWVLMTACQQAMQLQRERGVTLRIAVNLSVRQFRAPDLLERIREALAASGLPAAQLEIEITESLLMSDTEDSIERLRQLRALGISVAIDDFGVGYSSLSYVTRFPVSALKIDRSFIHRLHEDPSNTAVAQTIIALAANLGIRVVAEGVETAEQLRFLREHRCAEAQGFLFSPGVPLEQFRHERIELDLRSQAA